MLSAFALFPCLLLDRPQECLYTCASLFWQSQSSYKSTQKPSSECLIEIANRSTELR